MFVIRSPKKSIDEKNAIIPHRSLVCSKRVEKRWSIIIIVTRTPVLITTRPRLYQSELSLSLHFYLHELSSLIISDSRAESNNESLGWVLFSKPTKNFYISSSCKVPDLLTFSSPNKIGDVIWDEDAALFCVIFPSLTVRKLLFIFSLNVVSFSSL